jgi:hypothetical protein
MPTRSRTLHRKLSVSRFRELSTQIEGKELRVTGTFGIELDEAPCFDDEAPKFHQVRGEEFDQFEFTGDLTLISEFWQLCRTLVEHIESTSLANPVSLLRQSVSNEHVGIEILPGSVHIWPAPEYEPDYVLWLRFLFVLAWYFPNQGELQAYDICSSDQELAPSQSGWFLTGNYWGTPPKSEPWRSVLIHDIFTGSAAAIRSIAALIEDDIRAQEGRPVDHPDEEEETEDEPELRKVADRDKNIARMIADGKSHDDIRGKHLVSVQNSRKIKSRLKGGIKRRLQAGASVEDLREAFGFRSNQSLDQILAEFDLNES